MLEQMKQRDAPPGMGARTLFGFARLTGTDLSTCPSHSGDPKC